MVSAESRWECTDEGTISSSLSTTSAAGGPPFTRAGWSTAPRVPAGLAGRKHHGGRSNALLGKSAASDPPCELSDMRWRPILFDLVVVVALWTFVLLATHRRRVRVAADPSPRRMRSYRLHTAALISVAVGITSFITWFISDAIGPQWLHTL